MGSFLRFVIVIACVVIGVGFYLGWFSFSKTSDSQKTDIKMTVDKEKFEESKEKAKEKVEEFRQRIKEGAEKPAKEGTEKPAKKEKDSSESGGPSKD